MPGNHSRTDSGDAYARCLQHAEATRDALTHARFEMGQNPNDPTLVKVYEDALEAHAAATRALEAERQRLSAARAEQEAAGTLVSSGTPEEDPREGRESDVGGVSSR
ncbi:MAG: hypothetical protein IT198_05360 [Acidimicrobiia bacterium]|nr:hypothetical protein [Acidimicrobiia bacterium]